MMTRRYIPIQTERIEPRHCTLDLRLQVLRQTPFLAALPPESLAQVNPLFVERGYDAGQTIYAAGAPATRLYVVARGTVKVIRPTDSGPSVLLGLRTAGEFCGSLSALGDRDYRDSAVAQTSCCILSVSAGQFQAMLRRYPSVALATLDVLAARLRAAHDLIEQYSSQPVEQRIAATLLQLGEKVGQEREGVRLIQMPLSRQDVAEMAGTTVETASRVMSQLRKDGLIQTGRRWAAIADRDRLAALAIGGRV